MVAAAGESSTACSYHFFSPTELHPLSLHDRRHSTTTLHLIREWEGPDGRPSGNNGQKLDPYLGLGRTSEPLTGRAKQLLSSSSTAALGLFS